MGRLYTIHRHLIKKGKQGRQFEGKSDNREGWKRETTETLRGSGKYSSIGKRKQERRV